ncbi:acyl carrier protein [Clostridium frigidicarnis]|uniref:Acyl carrier protein n=1 Tax=Clostridium frigidicarnis TaxID=84698 RepID=A0A1I0Y6G7_9CLOT|nr:phosphopantetheine-binding protein [Clostridium frigidicarnis]SFB07743.1 Acyl carrier protein [Clostridium frigidicarnis]
MERIKQKIREFLGHFFKKAEINDEDNIYELGYVNSLFAMQLVMFIEKEFSINIGNNDLDLNNFSSINAISEFIEKKKSS